MGISLPEWVMAWIPSGPQAATDRKEVDARVNDGSRRRSAPSDSSASTATKGSCLSMAHCPLDEEPGDHRLPTPPFSPRRRSLDGMLVSFSPATFAPFETTERQEAPVVIVPATCCTWPSAATS